MRVGNSGWGSTRNPIRLPKPFCSRAFALNLGLGPPTKGASIDRLSGVGASAGSVFYPGGSAVWPQCWLCAVCAVGNVGCCVCVGGYSVGVSISSLSDQLPVHVRSCARKM